MEESFYTEQNLIEQELSEFSERKGCRKCAQGYDRLILSNSPHLLQT